MGRIGGILNRGSAGPAGRYADASDEDLMRAFRRSADEARFNELFRRYVAPGLRTARSILRDETAAEDALQEAFLRLVRARRSYRPGSRFSSWFYTILRNVCRDELRRPRPAAFPDGASPALPGRANPVIDLERAEDADLARTALARLPDGDREVLALRVYADLSFAEIGRACGISQEAAKKRAQRGLARLRQALSTART